MAAVDPDFGRRAASAPGDSFRASDRMADALRRAPSLGRFQALRRAPRRRVDAFGRRSAV